MDLTQSAGDSSQHILIRQAGSIAKYVSTLAALRMESAGLLSLEMPVYELLPGYAGPREDALTLRRLLENRSGLEDRAIQALIEDPTLSYRSMLALDAANLFAQTQSDTRPGEAFDYVNSNWIVVQAILERVGRGTIAGILEKWVFKPAGAATAAIYVGDIRGPDRASAEGDYLRLPDFMGCAGALEARPSDLLALVAYPFLSSDFDDTARQQLATHTTPEQNYTLGGRFLRVSDSQGKERMISWQSGNNGPWAAVAAFDPATGEGFAAMSHDASEDPFASRDAWLNEQGLLPMR